MSKLYGVLVQAAKNLRQTNHQYIKLINEFPTHPKDVVRWKIYMNNNLKEAKFYLRMAKAEKEYMKNGE